MKKSVVVMTQNYHLKFGLMDNFSNFTQILENA